MGYAAVKHLHLVAVALSWSLFFVRGLWMIADSPRLHARWVRVAPHVNDTLLLAAGVYLATFYGLADWIVAKLIALVAYVGVGAVAIRYGRGKRLRVAAWIVAQAVFLYIVAVALAKRPLPFAA
jgi:uncharacterized membrane protein SirB2